MSDETRTATGRRKLITEIRANLRQLDAWVRVYDYEADEPRATGGTPRQAIARCLGNVQGLAAMLEEYYEVEE